MERERDFGVRVTERDEAQHLDLALGEVVRWPGGSGWCDGQERPEPRVQVGPSAGNLAHGVDEPSSAASLRT